MAAKGDFGRLTRTINALRQLHSVPSQVAAIAAPRLTERMQDDAFGGVNPYQQPFAPLLPQTIKRWGPHPVLNLEGDGIASLRAAPMGGAGIEVTAAEKMRFAQGGTRNEVVRATLPNNPSLPRAWREILDQAAREALEKRLGDAK